MTIEQFIAAVGFLSCLALLVHHGLGERRQARLRHWWLLMVAGMQQRWSSMRRRRQARPGRDSRQSRENRASRPPHDEADTATQAEREAAELIERARRGKGGDDNVLRPRFGGRRKDLH